MDKFTKQPGDILDYDIQTDDWLSSDDYVVSAVTTVSPVGLTVQYTTVMDDLKTIKLWIAGGTNGTKYKTTTTITTHAGRVKEHELQFVIKEI